MYRERKSVIRSFFMISLLLGSWLRGSDSLQDEQGEYYLVGWYNGSGLTQFIKSDDIDEDEYIDSPDKDDPVMFGTPPTRYFGVKEIIQEEGVYIWSLKELVLCDRVKLSMSGLLLSNKEMYAWQRPVYTGDQIVIAWQEGNEPSEVEAEAIKSALKMAIKGELADCVPTTPGRSESPGPPSLLRRRSTRSGSESGTFRFPKEDIESPKRVEEGDLDELSTIEDEVKIPKSEVVALKQPVEKEVAPSTDKSKSVDQSDEMKKDRHKHINRVRPSPWHFLWSIPIVGVVLNYMGRLSEIEDVEPLDDDFSIDSEEKRGVK